VGDRRVRMWISGRVQGVCFRAYTCEEAQRLRLRGSVRNLPDGRVEVLAEGDPLRIRELEAFCRKGPPFARVHRVEIRDEPPGEGAPLTPFHIAYGP